MGKLTIDGQLHYSAGCSTPQTPQLNVAAPQNFQPLCAVSAVPACRKIRMMATHTQKYMAMTHDLGNPFDNPFSWIVNMCKYIIIRVYVYIYIMYNSVM